MLDVKQPAFLWGAPGVGKSQVVAQTATARGMALIDIRAVLLDPVDLRGLPRISTDGASVWCPPDFLPGPKHPSEGILFLDDLNSAPPLVQASGYQLVLDRCIGEYRLPDGWSIIAAGNREKGKAMTPVRIASTIPKPEQYWEEHCYPGQFERAGRGDSGELHELETPSHRGRPWAQTLRLLRREDNSYPEVEESFLMLRDAFEEALRAANVSLPMQEEHSLETTGAVKAEVAPGALAERFLSLARKSARPG